MRAAGPFILVAALVAGCAAAAPLADGHPELGHYFTLRTYGNSHSARLEGPRLHGSEVDIVKLADGFRGQAYSRIVDLRVEGNKIAGMVGSGRTELYVDEIPEGLRLKGLYAGGMGELELRSDAIRGRLGRCEFDLLRTATRGIWYEGRALCGRALVPARLALPDELPRRPLLDRAVWAAVFLGRA